VESSAGTPEESHFFIALCSKAAPVEFRTLVYVPRAANILRERELHIQRLEGELEEKNRWLAEALADRQKLVEMFRQQNEELERQNQWAKALDAQLSSARERVVALQQELAEHQAAAREVAAGYEAKVQELDEEVRKRTEWALETERRLTTELTARCQELAECVRLLDTAEATVEERTWWGQRLEAELREAETQLSMARASRWLRLGRALGLGPPLGDR
jgi:DNA repair exonuclease SbcCD ATPase subunit